MTSELEILTTTLVFPKCPECGNRLAKAIGESTRFYGKVALEDGHLVITCPRRCLRIRTRYTLGVRSHHARPDHSPGD